MKRLHKLAIPAAVSLVLVACGGGGSSDESTPATQQKVSFGGVAAIGAPLANAAVTAQCANGESSTSADANGVYNFNNIAVELPCLVQAKGTQNGQTDLSTFGLASQAGSNVNATTFTTWALQAALGVNSLAEVTSQKLQELKGQDMTAALSTAWSNLAQDLSERYGNEIFKKINPFEKFEANPNVSEIDKALELVKDLAGQPLDALYKFESHVQKVQLDDEQRKACADTNEFEMGKCWRVTMAAPNGYSWITMGSHPSIPSTGTSAWFTAYGNDFNIFKYQPNDDHWSVMTTTDSATKQSTSSSIEKMTIQACYGLVDGNNQINLKELTQTLSMVSPDAQMITQDRWNESLKNPYGVNLFLQKNCITYGGDTSKEWSHEDMAYVEFLANGSAKLHHKKSGAEEVVTQFSKLQINKWLFDNATLEILGEAWYANPFYKTVEEDGEVFDVFTVQLYKKASAAASAKVDAAFLVEGAGEYLDNK